MNKHIDVEEALRKLGELAGFTGVAIPGKDEELAVGLEFPHGTKLYRAVFKPKVDRFATLATLKANDLLITNQLSAEMAAKCHELGIQFIDVAGNMYLKDKDVFVLVSGRKANAGRLTTKTHATNTPAALKVTFALLTQPRLLNAPLRELMAACHVSLGLAGQVINGLQERGYIGVDGSGKRVFLKRRNLVYEWADGYISRLRPKLHTKKFAFPNPSALMTYQPQPGVSAWGGEVAASKFTGHLRPGTYTLYKNPAIPSFTSDLVKKFSLRADPNGTLEIIDAFWDATALEIQDVVPPELVYADLIATLDNRNLEVADLVLDRALADA